MMFWEYKVCHDALGVECLSQCSGSGRFALKDALGVEVLL